MLLNLLCHATQFEEFKDLHLTFHLGDDRVWRSDENKDYWHHNRNELKKVVKYYQESQQLPAHLWVDKIMAIINPQIPEDMNIPNATTIGLENDKKAYNISPTTELDISNPQQLGTMIHQAVVQLNANQNAKALKLLESILTIQPELIGLQYGKALALARLKRTEEAIEILQHILTVTPSYRQAQLLFDELSQTAKLIEKKNLTPINIYHCCVHKTASQWLMQILADARIYHNSGFKHYHLQSAMPSAFKGKALTERLLTEPLPQKTIVSPLYFSFDNFFALPKPNFYKAFFVMRDPRDLVISLYFSHKYSHQATENILKHRKLLNGLSLTEGLLFTIEKMNKKSHFAVLRSWIEAPEKDPNVLLLRYEDLIAPNNLGVFKKLFSHCDLQIPESVILALLQDYRFEKLSGGRNIGEEDHLSHYRKGIAGDWKNYFNDTINQKFKEVTGDLVTVLGYEASNLPKNEMSSAPAISTKLSMPSYSKSESNKVLIFAHIPKAGGTTLKSIIRQNYAEDTIFERYHLKNETYTDILQKLSEQELKKIKCYVGHFCVGIHQNLPYPATYITLLRNPIDRIISLYYFIIRNTTHRFHDELIAKQMSLKDFVVSGFAPIANTQTGKLACIEKISDSPVSMDDLRIAKQNLGEHFLAVGTTEKFDDFLQILQKRFGWQDISYHKQNVTNNRLRIEDIPKSILKLIAERNELDLELYEFVKNRKW